MTPSTKHHAQHEDHAKRALNGSGLLPVDSRPSFMAARDRIIKCLRKEGARGLTRNEISSASGVPINQVCWIVRGLLHGDEHRNWPVMADVSGRREDTITHEVNEVIALRADATWRDPFDRARGNARLDTWI